ncbi:MAG TPA: dihydrodipicolinate reductase C-terminal domain-containing protein [Verrucomicrobiae bacterium]|nr:dihydrodipicolinate reductase C-terminal domain-containing protein [Verrucomicrobiae bacterium]
MTPVKIIICGSKGRMGQTLIACVRADPELQLAGEIDQGDDLSKVVAGADAVVDFSVHDATAAIARLAAQHRKALVIGTTGHTDAERQAVCDAVKSIPCVWTSNFSTGVNVLFWMTGKLAEIVGPKWDAEISETHHTAKKDAPSGTAKTLQAILKKARGRDVPAHALRVGDVVGDHTVTFGTAGERLELTHRAGSRETLARGALRAAKWAVAQRPGLYDMQDVLGLR